MNPDTITAIIVGIIALIALCVSIWQLSVQRKHNKLSVKPCLIFDRIVQEREPNVLIAITNHGGGTAFFQEFDVTYQNEKFDLEDSLDWPKLIGQWGIPKAEITGHRPDPKSALAPNCTREILKITIKEKPNVDVEKLRTYIHRIDIQLKYKSLYDDDYEVSLNSDLS